MTFELDMHFLTLFVCVNNVDNFAFLTCSLTAVGPAAYVSHHFTFDRHH
jgi:hypothetical protein